MRNRSGFMNSVQSCVFNRISILTALVLSAGCSPDSPLDLEANPIRMDCSVVDLTYENFGKSFFQDYCLRCHTVTLETDWSRVDAPQEINFDTMLMAREFRKRIRLRAGLLGDMPPRLIPGPMPSEGERVLLIEWIECGMLSENYPEIMDEPAMNDAPALAEPELENP